MSDRGGFTIAVRSSLVLVLALVVQTGLVADLRFFGAFGDVMLLVGIAAGIAGGPERGATYGFMAGMLFDLVQPDIPFGLSALAYCIVGYLIGSIQGSVLRATWWIPVVSAAAASALGVILYAVLARVVGEQVRMASLAPIILVVSTLNALLTLPAVRLMRWAMADRSRVGALR